MHVKQRDGRRVRAEWQFKLSWHRHTQYVVHARSHQRLTSQRSWTALQLNGLAFAFFWIIRGEEGGGEQGAKSHSWPFGSMMGFACVWGGRVHVRGWRQDAPSPPAE